MNNYDPYDELPAHAVHPDDSEALQDPLDREMLAAHFEGYELEQLITVTLNSVELVTLPSAQNWKGGEV